MQAKHFGGFEPELYSFGKQSGESTVVMKIKSYEKKPKCLSVEFNGEEREKNRFE